jgi:hypothetical protein
MAGLETNIFPITNLSQLTSVYHQYQVKGLNFTQRDYHANRQILQKKLSYKLQNPVLVVERDGLAYLILRADLNYELPQSFPVVRGKRVSFEPRSEHAQLALDYTQRSPINDAICLRFLQFAIQGEIRKHRELWQTQSGHPFFNKTPVRQFAGRDRFSGFSVRPIITHDGGIGLCVDITSKTLSRQSLPTHLPLEQFHKWRYQRCIYRYGDHWYEIQVDSLSDHAYSEHELEIDNGELISLQEFITRNVHEPLPPEVANLPPDASVVVYYNNRDEERAAPTPLCYPIFGTNDDQTGKQHGGTILYPNNRREQIHDAVERYLNNMHMGDAPLSVSQIPLSVPRRTFQVPDLRFGNGTVLSVRQTEGTVQTELDSLGKMRASLLLDDEAGFYEHRPLDHQYLILPMSVNRSWGKQFVADLKSEMKRQYPKGNYNPTVLEYDDSGKKSFVQQGRKLRAFIRERKWKPGYAVVMIHWVDDRHDREEDQLAAMVLREMRAQDVPSAVIHTDTGQACYEFVTDSNGKSAYQRPQGWGKEAKKKRGQLSGYLRNVALNKILLTNWRWPFVLETHLHADITIGLDVKNHMAGLVVVGKHGAKIRTFLDESNQKEKLLEGQAYKYFKDILQKELKSAEEPVNHIVVHRDGIAFDTEVAGIKRAINELKQEGTLSENVTLTILEIAKSSMVDLRLFEITKRPSGYVQVNNPQVGDYHVMTDTEAYLCSTGRAFEHPGTSNPLHVRYVEGELGFQECLEDVYALTVLAWTRPEDCSRYPITIRLLDRFLRERATEYDTDELNFNHEEQELV